MDRMGVRPRGVGGWGAMFHWTFFVGENKSSPFLRGVLSRQGTEAPGLRVELAPGVKSPRRGSCTDSAPPVKTSGGDQADSENELSRRLTRLTGDCCDSIVSSLFLLFPTR
jgi:hypothetical protein